MNGILTNSTEAKNNSTYYNKFWDKYKLNNEDIIRSVFIKKKLKKLNLSGNVEILDLGCGYGWMSEFIKNYGSYTGIDFSAPSINFANKEFNGNFILADETSVTLGLPIDKKFDIVICSEVIEHVVDQNSFLEQIYMFLKDGGHLILTTPNGLCWNKFSLLHDRADMQPIENWLSPNQITALCVKNNFSVLSLEGRIMFPLINNRFTSFISRFIDKLVHSLNLENYYMYPFKNYSLYLMLVIKKL
jgi:2-polyprenyl-3-methyl-5-hydroxy-6-metoxy-1,4-benzoquinol methylase